MQQIVNNDLPISRHVERVDQTYIMEHISVESIAISS